MDNSRHHKVVDTGLLVFIVTALVTAFEKLSAS